MQTTLNVNIQHAIVEDSIGGEPFGIKEMQMIDHFKIANLYHLVDALS